MQYKVPQDVQREDQIIGPLTLRQLIIVAVGGGMAYMIYVQLSLNHYIEIWLPPVFIISALTVALAFLKIHGLPFHQFLMHFIEYKFLPKKRIWIQKTGNPYMPPEVKAIKKKKVEKQKGDLDHKKEKSIDDLVNILNQKN
jgi:hypothetical protein